MITTHDLLHDTVQLENELSHFEVKFGMRSAGFYEAMMRGDLEEFDASDKYRMTFLEWLALYKTWLINRAEYKARGE